MSEATRPEAAASAAGIGAVLPALLTDGAVLAFAAWTVGCHVLVLSGATARMLDYVAAAVVLGAAAVAVVGWRGRWFPAYARDALREPAELEWELGPRARWGFSAGIAGVVGAWFLTRSLALTWGLSVMWLGLLATRLFAATPRDRDAERVVAGLSRHDNSVLGIAASVCASLSLLIFRPRTDDAFYVNMALSVVDRVDEVLLSANHIHGPPSSALSAQPMFPPYRVHTFELLIGWLSRATGIETVVVEHMLVATVLAGLLPYALFRLLRILTPGRWLLALVAVLVFYLVEGGASRGYSNQALVRLFHGKSVMLTLATPLLCAYGIRFAARPSLWRWMLLGACQIAALGLSSTAIWWAPTMAMVAVVACVMGGRRPLRTCGLAVLSSLYALSVGAWVKVQLLGSLTATGPSVASLATKVPELGGTAVEDLFGYALPIVLGPERTAVGLLSALALACVLPRRRHAPALFLSCALAVALLFANPWLSNRVVGAITGAMTYQRVFWLLPIPLALATASVAIQGLFERLWSPRLALLATCGVLGAFFLVTTDRLVISAENGASLKFPPSVKQWPHARMLTRAVCDLAPAGRPVLAPATVMLQLGTRSGCAPPLLASERWLSAPRADIERRYRLEQLVDQRKSVPPEQMQWFVESLDHYDVGLAVLSKRAIQSGPTKSLLRWAGFTRVAQVQWDHLWVRPWPPRIAEHAAVARALCSITPEGSRVVGPFGLMRAVGRSKCNAPIIDPGARGVTLDASHVDLVRLETILHTPKEFSPPVARWLKGTLKKYEVDVIVTRDYVLENRALKRAMREAGFARGKVVGHHHVFVAR